MTSKRRTPIGERRPAASSVTARRRRPQRHVGPEPLPLTAATDVRLSAGAGPHTTLSLTDRLRDKTALVFSVLFLYYSLFCRAHLLFYTILGMIGFEKLFFAETALCDFTHSFKVI